MAYIIQLTNGKELTVVQDGTVNSSYAGIQLVGKQFKGFGTSINTNFIRLTENFCYNISPANPLTGQLWFNNLNNTLNVYDGTIFKNLSISTASATAPTNASEGDEWFNTINQQLYVYNGLTWVLIGPTSLAASGLNGIVTEPIVENSATYYVAELYANNRLVGIISSDTLVNPSVQGFGNIRPGINFVTSPSTSIVDGGLYNLTQITVGNADQLTISPSANNSIIASPIFGSEIIFQVNNSNVIAVTENALLPSSSDDINIGSSSDRFGNIYADNIYGNYIGQANAQPSGDNGQVQFNNNGHLGSADIYMDTNGKNPIVIDNFYVNGTTFLSENIFYVGTGANGAVLTSPTTTDIGMGVDYFDTAAKTAFFGLRNSDKSFVVYHDAVETNGILSGNLGNITGSYFNGTATSADYADLAERYEADDFYEPGTIVVLGGSKEITAVNDYESTEIFGVVSSNPAFVMNASAGGNDTHPLIAVIGRVPIKVIGEVKKFDRLVAQGNGVAVVNNDVLKRSSVFAYALEDNNNKDVKLVLSTLKK